MAMAATKQDLMFQAWFNGRKGHLSAMGEAKAWALREAWRDKDEGLYGMLPYIAGKVYKNGPGKKHPSPSAVSQLFSRMDGDKHWFPGKKAPKSNMAPHQ